MDLLLSSTVTIVTEQHHYHHYLPSPLSSPFSPPLPLSRNDQVPPLPSPPLEISHLAREHALAKISPAPASPSLESRRTMDAGAQKTSDFNTHRQQGIQPEASLPLPPLPPPPPPPPPPIHPQGSQYHSQGLSGSESYGQRSSQHHHSQIYNSPSSSTHSSSQHHLSSQQQQHPHQQHQQQHTNPNYPPSPLHQSPIYYNHPASQHYPPAISASGPYSSSTDHMATASAMRAPPPPNLYHTPQSNSPVSVQSPQDPHQRSIYGPPSHMYYPQYGQQHYMPVPMSHSPYSMGYQQHGHPLQQHVQPHPQSSGMEGSAGTAAIAQAPLPQQRYGSQSVHTHITSKLPSTGSVEQASPQTSLANPPANPGPIPATTPLVSKMDSNGVQYITFEYSRDRVKVQYEIRCDVETVDLSNLADSFKEQNCVYPRACKKEEPYKGNRFRYENECNELGWALAHLNEELRSKRGLIQRAVDSWRNSNSDQKMRSRRVRRMHKTQARKGSAQPSHLSSQSIPSPIAGPAAPQSTSAVAAGSAHHHRLVFPEQAVQPAERGSDPSVSVPHHQQMHAHNPQQPPASTSGDVRMTNNFYPTYPIEHTMSNTSVPPTYDDYGQLGPRSSTNAVAAALPHHAHITNDEERHLFGELSSLKTPKNFSVHDSQRDTHVRIKFNPESVNLKDISPPYRKSNSVFPRSAVGAGEDYPQRAYCDVKQDGGGEEDDSAEAKVLVPVLLEDGWTANVPVPRFDRARRIRERKLNDIGSHILWEGGSRASQHLSHRPVFLGQALNKFRVEAEKSFTKAGRPVPDHFRTRVGKREWQTITKEATKSNTIQDSDN